MFLLKNVLVNSKATRLALKEKPDFSARFCGRGKPKGRFAVVTAPASLKFASRLDSFNFRVVRMARAVVRALVAALAVGFIIVGSLVTRWKEK
jgi:hypothetical protein